jgi:hypothetical protein
MNAQEINTLGGVCQLWGIALIVRDLVAAHILRGDPARLRRWLTKVRVSLLPLVGRHQPTARSGHARLTSDLVGVSDGIRVELWPTVDPAASLEQRVAALERLPDLIADQLQREREAEGRARARQAEQLRKEFQAEAKELRNAAAVDRSKLKELHGIATGNIRLRWEGVSFVAAGVVFTTWPEWTAGWWPSWLTAPYVVALVLSYIALVLILLIEGRLRRR